MSYFVFVQVAEHSLHFTKTSDGFDLYKISYKFVLYRTNCIMHHIISNLIGASEHTRLFSLKDHLLWSTFCQYMENNTLLATIETLGRLA